MKRELINTIKIDAANLEFIAKTGKINGTLLIEIERVMTEYARKQANGLERSSDKCHIQNVTVSLPLSNEQILKGIQTSPRYQLPKEWLKNEHTNSNYMGGFLNAVKWMEGNAR